MAQNSTSPTTIVNPGIVENAPTPSLQIASEVILPSSTTTSASTIDSPGSASREVLQSGDLLPLILHYLAPPLVDTNDKAKARSPETLRDIRSCIIVSRSFSEPALDLLWESLDSILPLFKLLPGWTEILGSYFYHGDLRSDEARTFLVYRLRVKHLVVGVSNPVLDQLSPSAFIKLSQQLESMNQTLFPCLRSVQFVGQKPLSEAVLSLIRSPLLSKISVVAAPSDTPPGAFQAGVFVAQMFPSLASFDHRLHHVSLKGPQENLEKPVLAALSSIKTLRSIDIESKCLIAGPDFTELLKGFDQQRPLSIRLVASDAIASTIRASPSMDVGWAPRTPSLKACDIELSLKPNRNNDSWFGQVPAQYPYMQWTTKLTLELRNLQSLGFLSSILDQLYHLKEIVLKGTLLVPNVVTSMESAYSRMWKYKLESFKVFIDDIVPCPQHLLYDAGNYLISQHYPQPTGTRTLFSLPLPSVTPCLRSFMFTSTRLNLSLNTLVRFALKARALEELGLSLDSSHPIPDLKAPETIEAIKARSSLRRLYIRDIRAIRPSAQEYRKIAELLVEIFPNLESVEPYTDAGGGYMVEDWELIEYIRKMLNRLAIYRLGI